MVGGKLNFTKSIFQISNLSQESPTLSLANDCFRFVTGFFEVISTSAQHIYHSALLLTPRESVLQKLYAQQAQQWMRIVQGTPTSWDPSIASKSFSSEILAAAWSPCSRFIAIGQRDIPKVVVLDGVTLEQLYTMYSPHSVYLWDYIIFSPSSHLLTACSYDEEWLISWDLQTGGLISTISPEKYQDCLSITYSRCETMVGCLFDEKRAINTYNVLSGKLISSYPIQQPIIKDIWTCDEYLQYATGDSGSITIWQVSFTSTDAPTKVASLYTPDNFSIKEAVLLPTLSQLAFIANNKVQVWDIQHQKILLDPVDVENPRALSFSPDGHFFLCGTDGPAFHLWKKSFDNYIYCQKFGSNTGKATPMVSPNGELIISFQYSLLQIWATKNPTQSSTIPTQEAEFIRFLIEFSPSESMAAIADVTGNTTTILDLKSGSPLLVIDTATKTCGIGITDHNVVIVDTERITMWDLSVADHTSNSRVNIDQSIQSIPLNPPFPGNYQLACISPDFNYVAVTLENEDNTLYVYSMHTGEKLARAEPDGWVPGFTQEKHVVWCASVDGKLEQWAIIQKGSSHTTELKQLGNNEGLKCNLPWCSEYSYQVMRVLSSSGKRLLWLPHNWRPKAKVQTKWGQKCLGLQNADLLQPVIMKLEV